MGKRVRIEEDKGGKGVRRASSMCNPPYPVVSRPSESSRPGMNIASHPKTARVYGVHMQREMSVAIHVYRYLYRYVGNYANRKAPQSLDGT